MVGGRLNRLFSPFSGADADDVLHRRDENFSVADTPRVGGLKDGIDGALKHIVLEDQFDFHLGQEIDDVFSAAIQFGVALLAAEPLGFKNGNSLQADLVKGFLHFVQLERFDDGFDFLHWLSIRTPVEVGPRFGCLPHRSC
mgnify:CR=1 FL=1